MNIRFEAIQNGDKIKQSALGNECPGYDIKQSDGKAPVTQQL